VTFISIGALITELGFSKSGGVHMATEHKEKLHLVVSDDENPKIEHMHGATQKVVSVSLVDPKLAPAHVTAARLCGGSSTCVAIHQV
jgi:hypothetical protein